MPLFYHELIHLSLALLIGYLVWKKFKQLVPAFAAALSGAFLIDADHLFDYFMTFGFSFNPHYFWNSIQFEVSRKVYVPFHAWEYIIILSIAFFYLDKKFKKKKQTYLKVILSLILALNLGIYSHLIVDTITNGVVPLGYSLIYRAKNNFNLDKIAQ
jgi:hypothetical protein